MTVVIGSPASMRRIGVAMAPRPTTPTACASVSRSATGSGCSRADQRGRRHTIARDALRRRPPPRAAGRRASRAAAADPVARPWRTANPKARHRVCRRGRGSPIRPGRAGRSSQRRREQLPAGRGRRLDESVGGHRRRPVRPRAVGRIGFRDARARSAPRPAATSRSRPRRRSSMPVTLVSRLTSRTPEPAAAKLGNRCGADSVSITTSTSRSRSIAAPAATASTSATFVVVTVGSGATSCRARASRRASPGRPAAAGSRCRRRAGAAGRPPAGAAPAGRRVCPARRRGSARSASPRAACPAGRAARRVERLERIADRSASTASAVSTVT